MMGDLLGVGHAAIVGLDPVSGTWVASWFQGTSFRTQSIGSWAFPTSFADVHIADINGDGRADIIGRYAGTWDWLALQFNGTQFIQTRLTSWNPASAAWKDIQLADLNGDGGADVVGRDSVTGNWWATLFTGVESSSQIIAHWDPTINWQNVMVGDFNGDGRADVVGRDPVTGNWWAIWFDGQNFHDQIVGTWNPAENWQHIMMGDLFGNGHADIVGQDVATGKWWATWSIGSGFSTKPLQSWKPGVNYQNTMMGDFFGNGRAAIVGRDPTSGNLVASWYAGPNFQTQTIGNWTPADTWQNVMMGDLFGNGHADIVGLDLATGQWWATWSTGSGFSTKSLLRWMPALDYQNVMIGDLFGTGSAAIVGRDPSMGNWIASWNDGTTFQTQTIGNWNPASTWLNVAMGDLHNDGGAEIIGLDRATGNWWDLSFDGTRFNDQTIVNWSAGSNWQTIMVGEVQGVSNATLRRHILQTVPGLAQALRTNRLQAVQLLLDWTSNTANSALDRSLLITSPGSTARWYYNFNLPNKGGSYCSGIAWFFGGILSLFDISFLNVGFGDLRGNLTHSTIVVPTWDGTAWQYYIFDPTFNCTFNDSETGKLLTFFDLIDYLASGRVNDISVTSGSLDNRNFLAISSQTNQNLVLKSNVNGLFTYTYPGYGLQAYFETYAAVFTADGYSTGLTGFIELMKNRVFSVVPSTTSSAQDFINLLSAYGIPYGNP
jgi:hypothetical protein